MSDAKKKRAAAKKAKAPGGPAAAAKDASSPNENEAPANGVHEVAKQLAEAEISNERSCTSILTSHPQSRDIHLESFTLLFHGHELLVDTDLELNFGRYATDPSAVQACWKCSACVPSIAAVSLHQDSLVYYPAWNYLQWIRISSRTWHA